MAKRICLILIFALLLCTALVHASGGEVLGSEMQDFTVETTNGTVTLSSALSEKKAVFINLWASWCGYCRDEFPLIQKAYERFADTVEFAALSVEAGDGDEQIQNLRTSMNLTLPMGKDTAGLGQYAPGAVPATVVVDRFGKIAYYQVGAFFSAGQIISLLSCLTADTYTESRQLTEIPPAAVSVSPEADTDLSRALNLEGGTLVFTHPSGEIWPMTVFEEDGVRGVTSSNMDMDSTLSAVETRFVSGEGEAFRVNVRTSTLGGLDVGQMVVDGNVVKVFSGVRGWREFVYPLEPGEHQVMLTYLKRSFGAAGEDRVWYSGAGLVPAGDPEEYENTEAAGISVVSAGSCRVVAETEGYFGEMLQVFLTDTDMLDAKVTLPGGTDEEAAVVMAGNSYVSTDSMETEDHIHFMLHLPVTGAMRAQGIFYLILYPSADGEAVAAAACVMDEETLRTAMDGEPYTLEKAWTEADSSHALYTVKFVDQEGRPVPQCVVNLCTDTMCQTFVSDENGMVEAEMEKGIYHVQVLKIPEGYSFDLNTERYTQRNGGTMEFVLSPAA